MPLIFLPTSHGSEKGSVTTFIGRAGKQRGGKGFPSQDLCDGQNRLFNRDRHSMNAFQIHNKIIIIAKTYMLNPRLVPDT